MNTSLRFDPHFASGQTYRWTGLDVGGGKANTNEYTAAFEYDFTTHWQTTLYTQWNNEDQKLGINYRIHWIPSAGNDVYLAYNNRANTDGKLKSEEATILVKAIYRVVI